MKKLVFRVLLLVLLSYSSYAQLRLPPVAGNKRATVSEEVGITKIEVAYSRPDVNGREGNIWGKVVPYGFSYLSFITYKPGAPWRGGANENTTISLEHDVTIEGKQLKAGSYGLHFALWPDSCLVMFSKVHQSWGSFYYDPKDDALRVVVKPEKTNTSVEYLKYEFVNQVDTGVTLALMWEKLIIPIRIQVAVDDIVIQSLADQLKGALGFQYQNWVTASQYCFNAKKRLDMAEDWARRAIVGFGGARLFATLNNYANILRFVNKSATADSVMREAVPIASTGELYGYGISLLKEKKEKEAATVLNLNHTKFGSSFITELGLAKLYSYQHDFSRAIATLEKIVTSAPNPRLKKEVEDGLAQLKQNKEMNY